MPPERTATSRKRLPIVMTLLGFLIWPILGHAAEPRDDTCKKRGTAFVWEDTPGEALVTARREGKLVFLIHTSGNFARSEFT